MANYFDKYDEPAQTQAPPDQNYFDKYDTPAAKPPAAPQAQGNYFDKYDASKESSGYVTQLGSAVARGAVENTATQLKGLGAYEGAEGPQFQSALDRILQGEDIDTAVEGGMQNPQYRTAQQIQQDPFYKAGRAVSDFGQRVLPRSDDLNPLVREVAEGAGSVVGNIGTALIPAVGPAVALTGTTASGAGEQVDRAIKSGATPEQISRAARYATIGGATDFLDVALPMLGSPGRLAGLIGKVGARALIGALAEGGQEGLQQFIQNAVAKGIYKPDQDLMEDVPRSMLVGMLVGGGTSALLGHSNDPGKEPTQAQVMTAYDQIVGKLPQNSSDPTSTPPKGGTDPRLDQLLKIIERENPLPPQPSAVEDSALANPSPSQPTGEIPIQTTGRASAVDPGAGGPSIAIKVNEDNPQVTQQPQQFVPFGQDRTRPFPDEIMGKLKEVGRPQTRRRLLETMYGAPQVLPDLEVFPTLHTTTVGELLQKNSPTNYGENPVNAAANVYVGQRLQELVSDIPVHFVHPDIMGVVAERAGLDSNPKNLAWGLNMTYDTKSGKKAEAIFIRSDVIFRPDGTQDGATLNYLLLHEGTHAASVRAIVRNKDAHNALEDLRVALAHHWVPQPKGKDGKATNREFFDATTQFEFTDQLAERSKGFRLVYGIQNNLEFIAQAFSEPVFQNLLMNTPVPPELQRKLGLEPAPQKQTLWQAFVEIIRRALGLSREVPMMNMLEATMRVGSRVIDLQAKMVGDPAFIDREINIGYKQNEQAFVTEVGKGELDAVPYQPEFMGTRNSVASAMMGFGGTPQVIKNMAAHADRTLYKFYKYMAGLDQLIMAYPNFQPLLRYGEKVRQMHLDEVRIQDRAVRVGKDWRNLGPEQSEAVVGFINDLANMVYRTPQEKRRGIARHPTPQEFAALRAKWKVSTKGLELIGERRQPGQPRGKGVIGILDDFLTVIETNAIEKATASITDPVLLAKKISDIRTSVQNLRDRPYFPFMRFGDYFVTGKDKSGKVVYFELFERRGLRSAEYVQQAAYKELKAKYPQVNWEFGKMPENAEPFIGMPPQLLEHIASSLTLTPQQRTALEQLRLQLSPAMSFQHRFQNKDYTKGYSMDFKRAFARYFFHGARYFARTKWAEKLDQDIKWARSIKNDNRAGDLADFMQDHFTNTVLDTKGDYGLLKGAMFMWGLGYVPAAALQNASQTPMLTYPYLAAKFGQIAASRAMINAMRKLENFYRRGAYDNQTRFEMRSLEYGIKTGRITETQAPEIAAMGQRTTLLRGIGGNRVQREVIRFQEGAAKMFELAEQWNRRIAWRAALDLALKYPNAKIVKEAIATYNLEYQGLLTSGWAPSEASALVTAAFVVDRSQYVYARYARPRFMRGRIPGTLTIFMKYLQSTIMMFAHNKSDVFPRFLIMMALLGGLSGEPAWEEFNALLKLAGRKLYGKDWDANRAVREFIMDHAEGRIQPDLVLHGFSRFGYGLPAILDWLGSFATGRPGRGLDPGKSWQNVPFPVFDRSRSISMGRILPIEIDKVLNPTKDVNATFGEQAQRASGAAYSAVFNVLKAIGDSDHAFMDPKRWERAVPRFIGNGFKAFRYTTEGRERGGRGGNDSASTIVNYDWRDPEGAMEIIGVLAGYQTMRQQLKWDNILAKKELEHFYDFQRKGILGAMFEALEGGSKEEQDTVIKQLQDFNEHLPLWARGYAIDSKTLLKSMETRTRNKELEEAGVPSQRRDVPLYEHVDRMFPGVEVDVRRVR